MSDDSTPRTSLPSLTRNYVSFVGMVIAFTSLACIILLFLIDFTQQTENPYFGIVTYILLPGFLILGLFIVIVGMIRERRRRRLNPTSDLAAYPKIDLNDARQRRVATFLLIFTFLFVSMSAFGSYKAYHYTESVSFCGEACHKVMSPEFTAFQVAPHARTRCVDCHVGSGAQGYARSKLAGTRQLVSLILGNYSRPIPTPVHNLRPADETCGHCHWPEKFYGAKLKTFNHYAYDEQNSKRQLRMLINVGGGSPKTGIVAGIHWHMNINNEISFIASDDRRQTIPWIRVKDREGNVTEYYDRTRPLKPDQIASATPRRMDCVDCHNRPTHRYLPPDQAVDQSFAAGKLDPSLPYLKRQSVEVLTRQYNTTGEAVNTIGSHLDQFYKTNYADVYASKNASIKSSISEVQRLFQTYIFPEMKTDWQAHPDNLGHFYFTGCFRCHDGEHVSDKGKVIRNDCNVCHTTLADSANPAASAKMQNFQHPVDLGGLADRKCETCHKANEPFKHPVNLGDLSPFQCVECHPRK
ncbi:MAG TPA: cytochrome c3 family protein [Pyrinomonadaceae bacterium]|nr:cytochrome c3 family protein [Pyrinomonadaceae bacterium]